MWPFGRDRRREVQQRDEVQRHVDGYTEGRRLMRHGDGADEWIGMKIARENLLALIALGCDEHGNKATADERARVLRKHGLRAEADALAEQGGAA